MNLSLIPYILITISCSRAGEIHNFCTKRSKIIHANNASFTHALMIINYMCLMKWCDFSRSFPWQKPELHQYHRVQLGAKPYTLIKLDVYHYRVFIRNCMIMSGLFSSYVHCRNSRLPYEVNGVLPSFYPHSRTMGMTENISVCNTCLNDKRQKNDGHRNIAQTTVYYSLNINSMRPSDAIWRNKFGSTLAQVMACCLTAPSHYRNQCWLISKV